jgi:aryl-alcohol dehydrogenase-like predicted oxidoreductase
MDYVLLGRSGLKVSELCLGTMTFGEAWGWGASRDESRRIFDAFLEAGGNFIDTANRYTDGQSETFLGEFTAPDRDRFVIATKYTIMDRRDHPNASGNSRKNMIRSLEGSLRRLRTDYVDVLWIHAWDFTTPVEEVMRALDDLVRAGKVRYVGVSDTPAWVVSRAQTIAELRGWSPFVGLQIEYGLAQREVERELVPMARELGLAVVAWGALAGGVLAGKYAAKAAVEGGGPARYAGQSEQPRISERNLAIAKLVGEVAKEAGRTPSQVALAWLIRRPGVIVPIVGARRVDQLEDNLGCLDVALSDDQLRRLDEASQIALGFPHEFLARENIRDIMFGGFRERVRGRRDG